MARSSLLAVLLAVPSLVACAGAGFAEGGAGAAGTAGTSNGQSGSSAGGAGGTSAKAGGGGVSTSGGAAGSAGAPAAGSAGAGGEATAGSGGTAAGGGAGGSSTGGTSGVAGAGAAGAGTAGAGTAGGGTAGAGTAGGGTAGTGAAGAGTGGSAVAGMGGAAGAPGGGGQAGGGGATTTSCALGQVACGEAQYCNRESGACAACGDMNRFVVGDPEFLALMTGAAERSFPRVQVFGGAATMFLRTRVASGANGYQISSAASPFVGGAEEDCCVNKGVDDSGPLPLPASVTAQSLAFINPIDTAQGARFILLDSARPYSGPAGMLPEGRRVYVASRAGSQYFYAPVMLLDTGRYDYSVAYAYDAGPPRFFWMSERATSPATSDPPRLYTIRSTDAPGALKRVMVPLEDCTAGALEEDHAPWVTPNGHFIFFHARCSSAEPTHVYMAALAGDTFQGAAKRVPMVDFDHNSYRTPSLSPDRCTMYVEADNGIYALHRR